MPQPSQYVPRVIIRCLPMGTLAFPGVILKVFEDFPRRYLFVIIGRQLAESGISQYPESI
jgi:hypothetical protein